jgi:hypothetical protein
MTAVTNKHPWIDGVDISAADSFTRTLNITTQGMTTVSLNVTGTFSGTVTLQMWREDQTSADAKDMHTATSSEYKLVDLVGPCVVRAGIKTGEYTSGTAEVELAVV